jgi:hypothetical protein
VHIREGGKEKERKSELLLFIYIYTRLCVRVIRQVMQALEHLPRQWLVACAVHPNNAGVALEIEAQELMGMCAAKLPI